MINLEDFAIRAGLGGVCLYVPAEVKKLWWYDVVQFEYETDSGGKYKHVHNVTKSLVRTI
jgi:hypothetical protein